MDNFLNIIRINYFHTHIVCRKKSISAYSTDPNMLATPSMRIALGEYTSMSKLQNRKKNIKLYKYP